MDSIIFDVDGTLWDSVDPVAESWNLAIAENTDMTPDLTRDSLAWLFGKTMTEIADALFPQIPLDERMRLLTICFDYENRYLETHPGKMYDGVVDTIRELSLRYPLFIVSNCQCGYIEVMWDRTLHQRSPLLWRNPAFKRSDTFTVDWEKWAEISGLRW